MLDLQYTAPPPVQKGFPKGPATIALRRNIIPEHYTRIAVFGGAEVRDHRRKAPYCQFLASARRVNPSRQMGRMPSVKLNPFPPIALCT